MAQRNRRGAGASMPVLAIGTAVAVVVVACTGAALPGQPPWSCPSQPPSASYVTGSWPDSIVVADLNGDGKKDLVVANWNAATLSVLLGAGDGTFGTRTDYATDEGVARTTVCPHGVGHTCTAIFVATGDFNGDGKLDLAVANTTGHSISIFLGNGDGTFRPREDHLTTGQPTSLAVADFDGDGVSDVAVTNLASSASSSTGQGSSGPIDIFFGDRSGTLKTEIQHLGATLAAEFAIAADFDGDGKADLAVASPSTNTVNVFLGNGNGTFRPSTAYSVSGTPSYLAAGDFDGDGRPDLAVTSSATSSVTILLAAPDGTFRSKMRYEMSATEAISVAAGDFNGDHKLDLVVGLASTHTVVVLLGRGDGTFLTRVDYGTDVNPLSMAAGDFDGNGHDDLAVASGCATPRCDTIENDTVAVFVSCGR